mgnify:FL=1
MRIKINSLAVVCAALFAVSSTFASETEIRPQAADLAPLASKALLTDIVNVADQMLVSVGERGHILVSSDAETWQQASVPVQANLNSVYFVNKLRGWAVGHDATILATNDAGLTWHLQQFAPHMDKPFFDVYFSDEQNGIAVGAYGLFYRTTDGGASWQNEFHIELLSEDNQEYLTELKDSDPEMYDIELGAILPHFNRIFADGNVLYLVGEAGFAAKSTDNGQHWQRLEEFYIGSLFDITRTPYMSLLAVGLRGNAFESQDQGLSWQQIRLPETSTFNSVFADSKGRVYLVGNAGSLYVSNDSGKTFEDHSLLDGKTIVNGLSWNNKLVLATEVGIKTINLSELE